MAGLNKVMLIGRLGKDPEIRRFEDGGILANFSLATSESYKGPDGVKVESTEWHNIVVRRKLAEIAEKYLSKGKQVFVEGKIKTRSYEQDGTKRYIVEIIAENFTILEPKDSGRDPYDRDRVAPSSPGTVSEDDEDDMGLPF